MRTIGIFLILTVSSMALKSDDRRVPSNEAIVRSAEQLAAKLEKHRLKIDGETGLDGKVRSIRLDTNVFDQPMYGNSKNGLKESEHSQKLNLNASTGSDFKDNNVLRVLNRVKPKRNDEYDVRSPIDPLRKVKRSADVATKSQNTLDDLDGAEAKVFRPLFVYRQQMNRRRIAKQKRKKYDPRINPKPKPVYRYPNRIFFY